MIVIKKNNKKFLSLLGFGLPIGIINGLFGAGGGMLTVPLLKKEGMKQKEAHANAVAVILPITALSAILYIIKGYVDFNDAWKYIPAGLIGSILGTVLLKKIKPKFLKKIFAAFMIYAGIRMIF